MATFTQIRNAIKTVVEANITGLKVHARMPTQTTGHCLVVQPAPGTDFDVAMGRGLDTWHINLMLVVPLGDADVAQLALDAYVDGGGARSIRKVIFSNKTLGLTNTSAHVSSLVAYGPNPSASFDNIGAVLRMTAHTKPS